MEETLLVLIFMIANGFHMKKNKKRPKRFWARKRLTIVHEKSAYFNILSELRNDDAKHHRNYSRINHETFQVTLVN